MSGFTHPVRLTRRFCDRCRRDMPISELMDTPDGGMVCRDRVTCDDIADKRRP